MNSNWGRSDPSDPKNGNASSWAYGGNYRQWQRTSQVKRPSDMYVFIDEHPNSINDAFFIVDFGGTMGEVPGTRVGANWGDLPAFYHNKACGFGFADGHSEIHKWQSKEVVPNPDAGIAFPAADIRDQQWYVKHVAEKP